MVETNNLFEVSMGKVVDQYGNLDEAQSKYYTKAIDFQNEMSEKLATNKNEMKKYQAMYYSMLKSQGINKNSSYLMSESLTKAGYDIASLYNLTVEDAMSKLKSGLAGQVEPLRKIGIDISESSLQKVINDVGIEKSVQQLSYAEKEVARYIAIVQQAGQAQGDFAKTFESPANQVRVFKNQLIELKQVAGSFIVNAFQPILVWANAIVMTIKEILKAFASLFGYDMNTSVSTNLGDVSENVDDIASGLGSATKKAKEFKKQILGFDELNNIQPPTEASGGSGVGTTGGIDNRLLDSLKEWDNKMSSISGKAQEIRDKMLEWLGFVRNDDGTWRLGEGLTNFKKILEVVKEIGLAILTWKMSSKLTGLLSKLGILDKTQSFRLAFGLTLALTGIYAQYNGTKKLLNGDIDLFTILETVLGTVGGALGIVSILKATKFGKALSLGSSLKVGFGITLAIQGIQVLTDGIEKQDVGKIIGGSLETILSASTAFSGLFGKSMFKTLKSAGSNVVAFGSLVTGEFKTLRASGMKLGETFKTVGNDALSLVPKSVRVVGGLAGITASSSLTYNAMKDLREGTIDTGEGLLKLAGGIAGATASGAMIGSTFGPAGTVIGAFAGFVISAASALAGWISPATEMRPILEAMTEKTKALTEEVKSNKEAYDKTVQSIKGSSDNKLLEIETTKKLADQLDDLVDSNGRVKKGNEERVDFILGELNEALGLELTRDGDIISKNGEVIDSYGDLKASIDEVIKKRKEEAKLEATQELYKEAIKEEIKAKEALKKAQEHYNDVLQKSIEYNEKGGLKDFKDLTEMTANLVAAEGTLEEAKNHYKDVTEDIKSLDIELTDELVKQTGKVSKEVIQQSKVSSNTLQDMVKNSTDKWEKAYNELEKEQKISMLAQSTTLETWSPVIEKQWKEMAEKSVEGFAKETAKLEPDVQSKILSAITTSQNLTPEMQQAWYNLASVSEKDFTTALSQMAPDTQVEILKTITQTQGLTPATAQAWKNLASTSKDSYTTALAGMDQNARGQVEAIVNALNGKTWDVKNSSGNLGEAAKQSFTSNLGDGSSSATYFVQGFTSIINSMKNNPYSGFLSSVAGLANKALAKFNSTLSIHSPSRETMKSAKFFVEGFATQIKKETPLLADDVGDFANKLNDSFNNNLEISSSLNEFSKGIKVNTKDMAIDTNQYINYGTVRGQIQAQSNMTMNGNIANRFAEASYEAFLRAMREEGINVNIEAKTEEGVIVKKASEGFREYVVQTGELPFPVPVG